MELGEQLRREEFLLDPDIVFLNQGSFGVVPRRILKARQRLQEEMERLPDSWYRRNCPKYLLETLRAFCPFVGAKPQNTVFVENVTTAMDSVCRSFVDEKDDEIMVSSLAYASVPVMAKAIATMIPVDIKFPIESKQQILESFELTLREHPSVKLAIIAHITSPTAIVMPIKELVELCHSYGVKVLVDGAHVTGQMPLNIEDIGADFYAGNIHKWFFVPRSCGFLWVASPHISAVRPSVVSHFHGVKFHFDFFWRGTKDDTSYMTIPDALQFHQDLGGWDAITSHNQSLLEQAVADLEQAWGTARLQIPEDMVAPYMRLVRVPDMKNYNKTPKGAGDLDAALYVKHRVQALCICVQGELYIRFCAHVYSTPRDYERLRDGVLELSKEEKEDEKDSGYELKLMFWDLSPLAEL